MQAEEINVLQSSFGVKACEELEEFAANEPRGLLAIPTVQAETRQGDDLHDVSENAFGHISPGRKVEPIVLDERHCVLVQFKEHIAAASADHDVPDNVSYVVNSGRTKQLLLRYVNFVKTQPLQIRWQQTDRHELVQLRVHVFSVFLSHEESLYGGVYHGENRILHLLCKPTQHRLRDLVVCKQPAFCVLYISEQITFLPVAFADVLLKRLLCVE
jgi:hypothetical protein